MRFDVVPLRGVNEIEFGTSRSMVRDMLGLPDSTMKRNEADAAPFDHYHEYGLFCYYAVDDTLEAVEFPIYMEFYIFGTRVNLMLFEELRSFFEERGYKIENNLWGFDVPEISIGVTRGFTDSFPEQDIEAFYAGRRGVLAST